MGMQPIIDYIIHKKILIADDDPAIVESLRLMLELADYQVTSTVDGQVMRMIQHDKPDLLILDILMSGVDGRDVCKMVKTMTDTKDIPIIMISASPNVRKSTQESGADDFLEKPFEMNELLEKVEKYITPQKYH